MSPTVWSAEVGYPAPGYSRDVVDPAGLADDVTTSQQEAPTLQPGLVAWWDVRRLDGATATALADGALVDTWTDRTAGRRLQVGATSVARPTWRATAGPVGDGCLDFDGVNDYLDRSGQLLGNQPLTAYVVVKVDSTSAAQSVWAETSTTSSQPVNAMDLATSTGGWRAFRRDDAANLSLTSAAAAGQTWRVLSMTSSPNGLVAAWMDGQPYGTPANSTWVGAAVSTDVLTVGARQSAAAGTVGQRSQFFDGQLAQLLLYTQAHTTGQRQAVEDYLASISGKTLTR